MDGLTSEFDTGTAVAARPGEPGTWDAELGEGWRIGGGVNGGLLLALVGRALGQELGATEERAAHQDPLAISAYYLTPGVPGPATVRTEVVRRGRAVSTAQASLLQPGPDGADVERVRVLATYGDLAGLDGDASTTATPPVLPPPEQCVSAAQAPPDFLKHASLLQRLDLRLDPATTGWAVGRPSGTGVIRGWLRMADGREPDPLLLLLAVDALPPVAFELGLPGWTPTLELTAHMRARPAPGWLRVNLTSRTMSGGYLEEDAEVWDSEGRLVALSRQLARATSPKPA
ncbi:thioesterase family protein [Phycicoccus sp. M110.8]|uniref:thioesterase family protein n=1 Tax=Phycicoccus sp. M110.8 TaxID=3075433 RepID=UPI0028FD151D|nr:thioesterase family protein [Phycicoccus sp. M110.8]MDU0314889.1 thioesterase family protein [Phycicoccus sp. M110.8]